MIILLYIFSIFEISSWFSDIFWEIFILNSSKISFGVFILFLISSENLVNSSLEVESSVLLKSW